MKAPTPSEYEEKRNKIEVFMNSSFPHTIRDDIAVIAKLTQILLKDRINGFKPKASDETGESYVERLKKYEHYDYHNYSSYMGVNAGPYFINGTLVNQFKPYGTLDQSASSIICEFLTEMIKEFVLVLTTRRSLLFESRLPLYEIYKLPECDLISGLDQDMLFTEFVGKISAHLPISELTGELESRIREEYEKLMKRVREYIKSMLPGIMGTGSIDSFGANTACAGFDSFSSIFRNFLIGLSVKISVFTFAQPGKITYQEVKSILYHAMICDQSDAITNFKPIIDDMFKHYEAQKRAQNAELKSKRDAKKKEKTG